MKLTAFKFSRHRWQLDLTHFADQILLVGQNASGKSKTIRALAKVVALISQKDVLTTVDVLDALLDFDVDAGRLVYSFSVMGGIVTDESLVYTDYTTNTNNEIISRDKETCILQGEVVNPPANKLVLNVRRDTQLYPEMEILQKWAENVVGFSFNEADIDGDTKSDSWFNGYQYHLNDIVDDMEKSPDAKDEFIAKMKEAGYNIASIKTLEFGGQKKIIVREEGLRFLMFDTAMSKGMFRTFFLVAYLLYFKRNKAGQPAMLLIDDLCEGLDYERSTKLGKLCFDMCEEMGIQLMASSNDSFLMDVVDLKYWNILRRNKSRVEMINAYEYPELFDHFERTGLNNFDLFSSDFIARYKDKISKK